MKILQVGHDNDKDIKLQINEYHKLNEELQVEKINLLDEFVVGVLIEKMLGLWNDYKQQLKHKHKKLSLNVLITHIIIEDTNQKVIQVTKGKEMAVKANLVEEKPHNKRYESKKKKKKPYYKPNDTNLKKKMGSCFSCGKPSHYAV
ncbi:hypothetical protein K1719_000631 [Acacia pycnantha]|nr:hypothetical protein K1719_000631 [Acacia pycnantha]